MDAAFLTDTGQLRLNAGGEKKHRFQKHFAVPIAFWAHSLFFTHSVEVRKRLKPFRRLYRRNELSENKYGKWSRPRSLRGKDAQGGFALLGCHWWLGWAKPVLIINHQGCHVTRHGFIQDFEHSGEEEEDKSLRETGNTALMKRINISSRITQETLLCWTGIFVWDEASCCIAHCRSGSAIWTILFFGYLNQINSNYLSHQKSCKSPCQLLQSDHRADVHSWTRFFREKM